MTMQSGDGDEKFYSIILETIVGPDGTLKANLPKKQQYFTLNSQTNYASRHMDVGPLIHRRPWRLLI
tara:strand:+ start:1350 stop:1550 length:201 start_codon:yes stop_codon:yes gene_type:complete